MQRSKARFGGTLKPPFYIIIMDSNDFARGICALITKCPNIDSEPSFLDKDNILWRFTEHGWFGKRAVFTTEFRNIWLEELRDNEEVKYWLHPEDSHWHEIFSK